ncbi:hypothetical protein ETB97_007499 [Aspergillus alliaceus]|uniref:NmrA-like domain-containing protein n=1 Tax=Petromyces alliaceus TaxID=209559 RepID=A0A8H5ZWG4_PETAA|nr:hypothetical protein ETB97_007499 [Aspergillus burnettii]
MSNRTVAVFPASGGIGGSTVKHLLPRLQANDLVFIARNPHKLEAESNAGATIRKADYDDDSSFEHAFDGVHALFLISYASVEHEYRSKSVTEWPLMRPSAAESDISSIPNGILMNVPDVTQDSSIPSFWARSTSPTTAPAQSDTLAFWGKTLTLKETVNVLSKIAKRSVKIQKATEDEFATLPQTQQSFTCHGVNHSMVWTSTFEAIRQGEGDFYSTEGGQIEAR